jgi:predicted AAA+ superfamily ATPase
MSLFELGRSNGAISLASLFRGEKPRSADPGLTTRDLIEDVSVGGWPGLRGLSPAAARRAVRGYLDEISRVDIQRVDGKRRDPARVQRVLGSLARHTATYATATTIANDVSDDSTGLKDDTVRDYVNALTRLMIVEDQPAWAPHLRSKYRLRQTAKRHFVDPSLAVAALRASPEALLNDLEFFGFLFESLATRDLRIYAQSLEARVLQYRDSNDLEVDAIVETSDGRWAAFEIKLGSGRVDDAADSLLAFANRIDTEKCGSPVVMAVIVGSGYGYVRDDGITVIPIGALGP